MTTWKFGRPKKDETRVKYDKAAPERRAAAAGEEPPQEKFPILTPAMERASVSHALAQLRLARTHGTHERIEIEIDFPVNRGNTA